MAIGLVDHPEEQEVKEELAQMDKDKKEKDSVSALKSTVKTLFNRSQFVDFISLFAVLVLTIVLSLLTVGWDITKIGWRAYIVNLSFLLFLGIYGLFFGEKRGRTFFKTWIRGAYQAAKMGFLLIKNKIVNDGYADSLPDYLPWRYEKECQAAYKMKLASVKLFDMRILDLSDEDYSRLKREHIEVTIGQEKVYFMKLSQKQIAVVDMLRAGELEIDYIEDYNYFLMDTPSDNIRIEKKVKESENRKRRIEKRQRISKLSYIVLFSIIAAGIFIDQLTGQSGAQTAVNLLSRITTLTTSVICGFNTARILNLIDIEVLRFKTSYDEVFYAAMKNGTFHKINYQEVAKEAFDKQEKEKEEALKNVVDAEPVNQNIDVKQIEEKPIVYGGCKDAGIESSTPTTEHLK